MTKQKQFFRNICTFKKKEGNMTFIISIPTLYSVLCWSTFGGDYSLDFSWVWRYKIGTIVFGEFIPFFSADPCKLCQVGWGALLHSYFQVSPEMLDWVQVRALAGPSRTFRDLSRSHSCVILAVCLGLLSCWKVNLRPSLRFWALWNRFSSRISSFIFPSILTCLPVAAAEKHPHSMMLPTSCFTVEMLPGFL